MLLTAVAFAGDKDPIFVNLTSDQGHRSLMAASFSNKMMTLGHPLTVYLNDKGVLLGSTKLSQFSEVQSKLATIIKNGGKVYICPMCMQEYGVEGSDLLKGLVVGNPKLLNKALFADNTQTLSW